MILYFSIVFLVATVHCQCECNVNKAAKDTITASLAQSLHEIADALLANSQQSQPGLCQPFPATTCEEIKKRWPDSASGYYTIGGKRAYCNMEELCGSGAWKRIAYLNMTDSTQNCPPGFRLYQSGGVRVCGRATSSGGSCTSVQFPSNGISYSQVCGRVVGYQWGSPDAVNPDRGSHDDINSYYVDGVSITHGSPRQHVWTLMAGLLEASIYAGNNHGSNNCPCSQDSPQNSTLQSFIGNDYFCESGNSDADRSFRSILYTSDPLWDGKGCGGSEGVCCAAPGLPWFNKILNTTTTDYLELRVCGDEGTSNEDTPVTFYELYIK
uniref:Fibrinogen C-terminal domain-containing protein n=1 Tax=Amphimedon queenslandica TaxID=400682 RepID=A0A1X7VUC1_AMPQE